MADAMTECIRVLIGRGVVRKEQLEILLLLAGEPERVWTAHAVAERITGAAERVAPILAGLAGRGLVSVTLEDAYKLDGRLDIGALQALRTTFVRDRTRVTDALRRTERSEFSRSVRGAVHWRSI